MAKNNDEETVTVDLDNQRDLHQQILDILTDNPDWCLSTYHHRNYYTEPDPRLKLRHPVKCSDTWHKTTGHMVAIFRHKDNCVKINRPDNVRWGLFLL